MRDPVIWKIIARWWSYLVLGVLAVLDLGDDWLIITGTSGLGVGAGDGDKFTFVWDSLNLISSSSRSFSSRISFAILSSVGLLVRGEGLCGRFPARTPQDSVLLSFSEAGLSKSSRSWNTTLSLLSSPKLSLRASSFCPNSYFSKVEEMGLTKLLDFSTAAFS